jgi:hypothetical protein
LRRREEKKGRWIPVHLPFQFLPAGITDHGMRKRKVPPTAAPAASGLFPPADATHGRSPSQFKRAAGFTLGGLRLLDIAMLEVCDLQRNTFF